MASNDNCLSEGPYGFIILEPSSEFIITPQNLNSQIISIKFMPKPDYSPELGDIIATVEIKDSQEKIIDSIDFETGQNIASLYNFRIIEQGKFEITIPAISVRTEGNTFQFRIVTMPDRQFIKCATVNVDAIASGYGFVYNYFQITEYIRPQTGPTGPIGIEPPGRLRPPPLLPPVPQSILIAEANYNFYDETYENVIANSSSVISENIIPNINVFNTVYSYINNPDVTQLHTLYGIIDGRVGYNRTPNTAQQNTNYKDKERKIIGDYFEEFTTDIAEILQNDSQYFQNSRLSNVKNFLFSKNYQTDLYTKNEKNKYLFPMHVHLFLDQELARNIKALSEEDQEKKSLFFESITKRQFVKALEKLDLLDYFSYCLMQQIVNNSQLPIYSEDDSETTIFSKYFRDNASILNEANNSFYLGDYDVISAYDQADYVKVLFLAALKPDTIEDQILMYEIEKSINGKRLQRYFIINNFTDTFINFIDTQVKYDARYDYKIYKYYTSTISSLQDPRYNKTLIDKILAQRGTRTYNTETAQSVPKKIKIEKMLIDQASVRILDNPPVIPQFEFIPYRGEDRKVLILLNSNTGKYEDYPISILESDQTFITKSSLNQGKLQNQKIKFKSDDLITSYEIFRIDFKPKEYADFKKGFRTNISTSFNGIKSNTASFIDTIEPNKKYYYIIRAKDVHNNISNPSIPFEIEIINESGVIYMLAKEFPIGEPQYSVSKQFNKRLQLKLKNSQTKILIPPLTTSELELNKTTNIITDSAFYQHHRIKLGEEEIKVWGKKFLMKITSKTTGKKIDINFDFKHTKNTREP